MIKPLFNFKHLLWIGLLQFVMLLQPVFAETVTTGKIMPGTKYETSYTTRTGELPGNCVVIIGGCHGDEKAGYLAAREIAKWQVKTGKLVILPDAHKEAIRRNARAYPGNMNTMFPGKKDGTDMQKLAYGIWRMIVEAKPDLVLTLHESIGFYVRDKARYGQTFTYDFDAATPFMKQVADKLNLHIADPLHKFHLKVEAFRGCPTYETMRWLKIPATSIETCRQLPLATRIKYQKLAVQIFLDECGIEVLY